jgi:hypothetical protein
MTAAPNMHESKLQLLREYAAEQLMDARQECGFALRYLAAGDDRATVLAGRRAAEFLLEAGKAAAEIAKRKSAAEAGDGRAG